MKNTAYRWLVWILPLLLLLAGVIALYFYYRCLDGCGPYHTPPAPPTGRRGVLEVVLSNLPIKRDHCLGGIDLLD